MSLDNSKTGPPIFVFVRFTVLEAQARRVATGNTLLARICRLILLPAALAAIDRDLMALIVAENGSVAATLCRICEAMLL
jgi:hypothetical protein